MTAQLYLNGDWFNSEEFNFKNFKDGVTIYEVIRIIDGIPLFLEDHLSRLYNSAALINFNLWLSTEELTQTINQLISKNKTIIGNVQILLNRLPHSDDKNFVCRFIHTHYPDHKLYKTGVKSMLFKAVRDNPNAKKVNHSLRKATDDAIKKNRVYEVILTNENNLISEGSRSNVFFVKDQSLITSLSDKVLAGVTRQRIFSICEKNGIKINTQHTYAEDLKFFDAAFFTGTSPKVLPIKSIGRTRLDPSNTLVHTLMSLYDQEIKGYILSAKNSLKK